MSTSILGTWNIWWSYWKKVHIVYMNASYKLPYCFSGFQWSPTLLKRHPVQDAVVLLEPRKVSMARMKSMKDTSLPGLVGQTWGAYYGKPGRPPSSMFGILFDRFQYDSITTASNGHFFTIMAMLRNGFVDAIKPNRSSNTKSSRQVFWVTRIDLLPATYGNCNCSKTKMYFRKD